MYPRLHPSSLAAAVTVPCACRASQMFLTPTFNRFRPIPLMVTVLPQWGHSTILCFLSFSDHVTLLNESTIDLR
jgi:hypothetical protein